MFSIDFKADSVNKKIQSVLLNRYPVGTNFFLVMFGYAMYGFTKVSGLECEVEVEPIQEGGVNGYVHALPKPKSTVSKLVFEKGIGLMDSQFVLKYLNCDPENYGRLHHKGEPGTILILDRSMDVKRLITFTNVLPIKWEGSDLDALSNQVMVEKFEIVHNGLTVEHPNIGKRLIISAALRLAKAGNKAMNEALAD